MGQRISLGLVVVLVQARFWVVGILVGIVEEGLFPSRRDHLEDEFGRNHPLLALN